MTKASHTDEPNVKSRKYILIIKIYREVHSAKASHTVHSTTIHSRQKVETIQAPFNCEWVLKKCISIQYSLTIKRNKVPIHATIWTNLKDIMLNKRTPTQSIAYCMNKFIGNF